MNWLKNNFPNLLTCSNLACGVFAIFLLSTHGLQSIEAVEVLVIIAGIADFLDGFAARILKSTSDIGKDLDSLADNITFGLLPCLVVFLTIRKLAIEELVDEKVALFAIPIAILSSVRLAIFNNDARQSDHFIGVPTPANAFFLIFLVGSLLNSKFEFLYNINFLVALSLLTSLWLVAPIPLIALKFKNFEIKFNWQRYLILAISIVLLLILGISALPFVILAYLAVSIINNLLPRYEL